MFEAAVINFLSSIPTITAMVGTYGGYPAIFSYDAPEDCNLSYMVLRIEKAGTDTPIASDFIMFIDYYDRDKSRVNCMTAARLIQSSLQYKILNDANYDSIRINYFSGSFVESDDPRDINYNLQFQCRAVESNFIKSIP
jgi:hypothetical protein